MAEGNEVGWLVGCVGCEVGALDGAEGAAVGFRRHQADDTILPSVVPFTSSTAVALEGALVGTEVG